MTARREPGGRVDHPALDAAEALAAVRVDEEDAHSGRALSVRAGPASSLVDLRCGARGRAPCLV